MRLIILNVVVISAACAAGRDTPPAKTNTQESGTASFYSNRMNGHITAGGQRFNNEALTAAHRTYPIGTRLRLTNEKNGRTVIVRVSDRGPFVRGRDISVTRRAARQLGFVKAGTAKLRITPLN